MLADKSALVMLVKGMPGIDKLVLGKLAQGRLVADMPAHAGLVVDKPALDMLAEGMPAQSRLGLLQRKKFTAELFQEEHHKTEQPMGKPPWGSGTEQGCPSKSGTGWTCSRQYSRRTADRDGQLRGSVPNYERPNISGPIRSIKMLYSICYVKRISVV